MTFMIMEFFFWGGGVVNWMASHPRFKEAKGKNIEINYEHYSTKEGK